MSQTLFEIVDDYQNLYELATDPDTNPEVFNDTLEAIKGALEVKSSGYVNVIKQLEMEAKQADEVSEMFKAKAEVRKNMMEMAREPKREAAVVVEAAIEPQTEALNLLATAVYFPNVVYNGEQGVDLVKAATTEYTDATAYNGWFDEVPEPPAQLIANAYAVNQNLIHVLSTFAGNNVAAGGAFEATLSAAQGYTMGSVIVTMGDQDVTATAYTAGTGAISIAEVTGPIQITATASAS